MLLPRVLVLSVLCVVNVQSYSRGPPESVCGSMSPHHNSAKPQAVATSPFSISLDKRKVKQGEKVSVTLSGGEPFKGFLVQARKAGEQEPLGKFTQDSHRYMACPGGGINNAVSHQEPSPKNSVTVQWEATKDVEGDVVFRCTFAKNLETFWVGVESAALTVEKALSFPGDEKTTTATQKTTTTTNKPQLSEPLVESLYEQCGASSGCFGYKKDEKEPCVDAKDCGILAAYSKMDDGKYMIQLQAETPGYVAIGFSKDMRMFDDAVLECVQENNEIKVYKSYNQPTDRGNKRLEKQTGISNVKGSYTDGILTCSFYLDPKLETPGGVFNLDEETFHVLVAAGNLGQDNVAYHQNNRGVSEKKIDISEAGIAGSKSDLLIKIHGALMIGAWIGAASCGIVMARYFKKSWANQCCGKDKWFQWHRFFMVTAWICTVGGFVVIFVELQDWTSEPTNPHAYLGVICTFCCFIQPFMALCRPGPTASTRPIFNWSHWAVGNIAHNTGIIAILFATRLSKANLPDYFFWVVIAYLVIYVITHFLLSIIDCACGPSLNKKSGIHPEFGDAPGEVFKMHSKGPYGGRNGKFEAGGSSPKNGWVQREPPRNKGTETCKKCYLFLFEVLIWAFVAVLIYVLVEKPKIEL